MIKFHYLRRLSGASFALVALKYCFWSGFFISQGHSIQLALSADRHVSHALWCTLIVLGITKCLVMLSEVCMEWLKGKLANQEMKEQWGQLFPVRLYADNVEKRNEFKLIFFEYLPELYEVTHEVLINRFTIGFVLTLTAGYFLVTRFYVGVILLLALFVLNGLSQFILSRKINAQQEHTFLLKQHVMNWSDQFFSAYQEISKNWTNESYVSWHNKIYQSLYQARQKLTNYYACRDLLCQCLVELPFVLNSMFVIYLVYWGYFTIAQLFVWFGMSQFILHASHAVAKNKILLKRKLFLEQFISQELHVFQGDTKLLAFERGGMPSAKIQLQDGTCNYVSVSPGMYPIVGGNGSGKSTFLNVLKGFNRSEALQYSDEVMKFLRSIDPNKVRLVARDAVVFDALTGFDQQVIGPYPSEVSSCLECVEKKMMSILPYDIIRQWLFVLGELQKKFEFIPRYQPSSGERILLSFTRLWFGWNQRVQLLIIDECDAFLDVSNRKLFLKTIQLMSAHVPVFIVTHSVQTS